VLAQKEFPANVDIGPRSFIKVHINYQEKPLETKEYTVKDTQATHKGESKSGRQKRFRLLISNVSQNDTEVFKNQRSCFIEMVALKLGMAGHICNPSYSGGGDRRTAVRGLL
jgi:hypothetical protein